VGRFVLGKVKCVLTSLQVVVLVLGNKLDLSATQREVNSVQALNWASRERIKLFEVSSLHRESLYEPFVHLSSRLNPPPSKSTFPQLNLGR
jgi:NF-kappa-B inhibitor-interacting Ras-like protein